MSDGFVWAQDTDGLLRQLAQEGAAAGIARPPDEVQTIPPDDDPEAVEELYVRWELGDLIAQVWLPGPARPRARCSWMLTTGLVGGVAFGYGQGDTLRPMLDALVARARAVQGALDAFCGPGARAA